MHKLNNSDIKINVFQVFKIIKKFTIYSIKLWSCSWGGGKSPTQNFAAPSFRSAPAFDCQFFKIFLEKYGKNSAAGKNFKIFMRFLEKLEGKLAPQAKKILKF